MSATTKLLLVSTGPDLPQEIDVSLVDFREAVLKQPDLVIKILRSLIGPPGSAPATGGVQFNPQFGQFPMDTPIFKMLSPEKAILLSPNAMKLTKADLLALGGLTQPPKTPADFNLTFDDLKTIQTVYQAERVAGLKPEGGSSGGGGTGCCCCIFCCCCCAVAVTKPIERRRDQMFGIRSTWTYGR
jgi:hypothetical protein